MIYKTKITQISNLVSYNSLYLCLAAFDSGGSVSMSFKLLSKLRVSACALHEKILLGGVPAGKRAILSCVRRSTGDAAHTVGSIQSAEQVRWLVQRFWKPVILPLSFPFSLSITIPIIGKYTLSYK